MECGEALVRLVVRAGAGHSQSRGYEEHATSGTREVQREVQVCLPPLDAVDTAACGARDGWNTEKHGR